MNILDWGAGNKRGIYTKMIDLQHDEHRDRGMREIDLSCMRTLNLWYFKTTEIRIYVHTFHALSYT